MLPLLTAVSVTLILSAVHCEELSFTLAENQPSGYEIGNIIDGLGLRDTEEAAELSRYRFSILGPSDDIAIHPELGTLTTVKPLDREAICPDHKATNQHCFLKNEGIDIIIQKSPPNPLLHILKVKILITDENDNSPKFPVQFFHLLIRESALVNDSFYLPSADDLDSDLFGTSYYELDSSSQVFGLRNLASEFGGSDLCLVIRERLDRERQGGYTLKLVARDAGQPPRSGMMIINVTIGDENDNSPIFQQPIYSVRVPESVNPGIMLTQVKATDEDEGANAQVSYMLSQRASQKVKRLFRMDAQTGELLLNQRLDFEDSPGFLIPIVAVDGGAVSRRTQAHINVTVADENDNTPLILISTITGSSQAQVKEHASNGTFVARINVRDEDSGPAGHITCVLDTPLFSLRQPNEYYEFNLEVDGSLDREIQSSVNVTVLCSDAGSPPRMSSQWLIVEVVDVNDQEPAFDRFVYYTMPIMENNPPNFTITQVRARDADVDDNAVIEYKLGTERDTMPFSINPATGVIAAKSTLDRETQREYTFTVLAADKGFPPLTASATVYIRLADENDNRPIFNRTHYQFTIAENMPRYSFVGKVTANDLDEGFNGKVWYRMKDASEGPFIVAHDTGIISSRVSLDREKPGGSQYQVVVIATDYGSPALSSSVYVTIDVEDVNDNEPQITSSNNHTYTTSYLTPANVSFGNVQAYDADVGDNGKLIYFIQDGNEYKMFEVNRYSGDIKLTNKLEVTQVGYYRLKVGVFDNGSSPHTVYTNIIIHITRAPHVNSKTMARENMQDDEEPVTYSVNLIVVVVLSSMSGLLSIILIIAIIRIRRQSRQNHSYNCRAEVQKLFSTSALPFLWPSNDSSWGAHSTTGRGSVFSTQSDSTLPTESVPQTFMTSFSGGNNNKNVMTALQTFDRSRLVKPSAESTNAGQSVMKNKILGRCKAKNSDSDSGNCEDTTVHNSTPVLSTLDTSKPIPDSSTTHPFHRFIAGANSHESVDGRTIPSSISSGSNSANTTESSHQQGDHPHTENNLDNRKQNTATDMPNPRNPAPHPSSNGNITSDDGSNGMTSASTINGERLCERIDEIFFSSI